MTDGTVCSSGRGLHWLCALTSAGIALVLLLLIALIFRIQRQERLEKGEIEVEGVKDEIEGF
jgi:hypothetical protein